MANAQILDMPMELCLKFMTVIRPDLADAKRELVEDVINEINCIGLGVLLVDF